MRMSYNAELYMHEMDKRAFHALNMFPQFVQLQKAYIENVDEKTEKIMLLSSAIRISEKQMPEIYVLLPPICDKLGICMPEVYMVRSEDKNDINAYTGGITNPYVCITSEMIKQFPLTMLASVLAHECGHIACKHYLYHSLARNFIHGMAYSPLNKIPAIQRYLSDALVNALLFWDRCSELSADRAAVLCDGQANTTIDMLLKLYGFENVNREEFLQQAMDLKKFVNESRSNKIMEQMMMQQDSHPMLATRVNECDTFFKSDLYKGIIDGTYAVVNTEEETRSMEKEVISTTVSLEMDEITSEAEIALEKRLQEVNTELERYTNHANGVQYASAVACGILTGWLDVKFFSETTLFENEIGFSHQGMNNFIREYARLRGLDEKDLNGCIRDLEQAFQVAQDNVWKGKKIRVSAKDHHLADLAHHPTPLGLLSSLMVQFLRIGTFVNKEGQWHFIFVKTSKDDMMNLAIPAIITGFLNWLVAMAENTYTAEIGEKMPKGIQKLAHVVASTPEILEIVKCADNWFGHLVSDMDGTHATAGAGMGIPGIFLSLFYEISALPIVRHSKLPSIIDDLYVHQLDLRCEIAYIQQCKRQAIPVLFNEVCVRVGFMILQLEQEIIDFGFDNVHWQTVIPLENRSIDRCFLISSMTFHALDVSDAAYRAAMESGADWTIFAGRFVARYNFVGAGRAVLAIVKEVSNEKKETQLIHEKMLLMDAKSQLMYQRLQQFKAQLEEKLSNYLAEDIQEFMEGFDYMQEGLATNDSNLVIKGNVVIQKVLGREPQFATQSDFDTFMESDTPLVL